MLSVRDIAYSHPGSHAPILSGCTLSVRPGEVVAVLGGRGVGKTTLARIVAGAIEADEGEVAFGRRGKSDADVVLVSEDSIYRFATDIVSDEVAYWLGECGIVEPQVSRRVREALSLVGISHLAEVKIRALSHVEAMLVSLACTVAMRPRYVVLDCVDAAAHAMASDGSQLLRRILDELRQRGSHVLVTTRRLAVALMADRCDVLFGAHVVWSGDPVGIAQNDVICAAAHIGAYELQAARLPDRLPPLGDAAPAPASVEGRTLELKGVTLTRAGIPVLEGVDLCLRPGRVTLVAGRSGDGKTSVSLVACALCGPDTGSVTLAGAKVRLGDVGLMPADASRAYLRDTVSDEVERYLRSVGVDEAEVPARARAALAKAGLTEQVLKRSVSELSAGERRLVGLACLLEAGFETLVLDEPTDGLDGVDADRVRELLSQCARGGAAVAVTSRDPLPWLAHVEDVTFLREGAVVFSGTKDACAGSAMPWVKAGLPVPRWLFDPQPPLGAVWGSTEGQTQLDEDSGLRVPETASNGRYDHTSGSSATRGGDGATSAYAGAPKGARSTGRRATSALRMRAARPHAKGHEGQARTTRTLLVWSLLLGIATLVVAWPALPLVAVGVGVTCGLCRMGARDLARLSMASAPVLVVASLLAVLVRGEGPAGALFAGLVTAVRVALVIWLVAAAARVSTPADLAHLVCAPLGVLRGLGADVDGWELSLARRLRYASLYLHELSAALACCRMREGTGRGLRHARAVSLEELRALARERARRRMV